MTFEQSAHSTSPEAMVLTQNFGQENLHLHPQGAKVDATRPLAPDEIRMEMKAASLNYRDWMMVNGLYNPRQPLPLTPLSDGVGTVLEVGTEVKSVQPGDRVCGIFCQNWLSGDRPPVDTRKHTLGGPLPGMWTRYKILPEHGVVSVPHHINDVEAATLPCAALTAWMALVEWNQTQSEETVLIQGTGGVSLFALQFASILGLRSIVTSRSEEKLDALKNHPRFSQHRPWATLHTTQVPQWEKALLELTEGYGVDHIIEVSGSHSFNQCLKALAPRGSISVIGVLSGSEMTLSIPSLLRTMARVQGIFVGHREGFIKMNQTIETHQLRPIVDRVFPWDDAQGALGYFAQGHHMGKVCLEF